jgi:AcrR family transcriptional regulator
MIAVVNRLGYNDSELSATGRPYTLRKRTQSAEDTRRRIIDAARDLIENSGYANISLDRIADAASVSRQTIYVQFGSKLGVLTAMAEEIENEGLQDLFSSLRESTGPGEVLHKAIPLDFAFMQKNAKIFRIIRAQGVSDPDFRAVLDERMAGRLDSMRRVIDWLQSEGKLAAGWTVEEAAEWLAAITGFHTYDELVNQRGWTLDQLSNRILQTVDTMLLAPGAERKTDS